MNAFENDDIFLLKKIVSISHLISSKDTDKAYKSVSLLLKNIEDELHEIRTEIDNEESYYDEDTVDELENDLREKANNDAINVLPIYFQAQRNEIAQKVRNISVAVFNTINNAEAAFQIISYSLEFNVNNLTKQKLQKDYEQLKEMYENRKESEEFSPELAKYATALLEIVQLIKQVENKQIAAASVRSKVNSLFSVAELNKLPNVFDEIREQIALALRGLSVSVWNTYTDIDTSIGVVQIAQKINVKAEIKNQVTKAFNELSELRDKEAKQIIEILQGINSTIRQVNTNYNQTVNTSKVQEVINDIFSKSTILKLLNVSAALKGKVFDELRPILLILPIHFVNNFVDKLSVLTQNDSVLNAKLQNMRKTGTTSNSYASHNNQSENETNPLIWIGLIIFIVFCISQCN